MGGHEAMVRRASPRTGGADHEVSPPGKATQVGGTGAGPTWDGRPYEGSVFANASPAVEKRMRDQLAVLDTQTRIASERLKEGAERVTPGELDVMRQQLELARGATLTTLTQLPTGHTLMKKAFAATDRATQTIARLDSVGRAHEARAATASTAAAGDKESLFASAAEKVPLGYCDTAPQQRPPCELDHQTRNAYRNTIRERVSLAHTSWSLAIAAVHLEEKLAKPTFTFERILGELILDLLFNVVGAAAKALVKHGISAAERGLTRVEEVTHGPASHRAYEVVAPDPEAVALARRGADVAIDKAGTVGKSALKEQISAQQLAERAANVKKVPGDREGFLRAMKAQPAAWRAAINANVEYLFDADLAGLVVGMPTLDQLTQDVFEARVEALLDRFDKQVLRVNTAPIADVRPIKVITGRGSVRHALAMPEKQPNKNLHREMAQYTHSHWKMDVRAVDRRGHEGHGRRACDRDGRDRSDLDAVFRRRSLLG